MEQIVNFDLTQELLELFIENTPIAYIILDEDRRVRYINKSFLELRKLNLHDTLGKHCYAISNGGVPCENCAVEQSLKTGKSQFVSRRDVLPDKSVRYIDDYAIPLHDLTDDGHKYTLEIMINRTEEMLLREQCDLNFKEIVEMMSSLIESKDVYTAKHSENVYSIAHQIATAMQLSKEEIFNISLAARLHDIGKVSIPNSIINKPERLTDEEFEKIKEHVVKSYEILNGMSSFKAISEIVRHHHERIDGKGYPDGFTGDQISLGAKIVAVADVYEAMTSDRSYRKALSKEVALKELKRVAGDQLDAYVVSVFESLNLSYSDDPIALSKNAINTVERAISPNKPLEDTDSLEQNDFSIRYKMQIFKKIFEHTPCGYVLMKPDHTVCYVSPFFLKYMGLTKEEVVGKKCFIAGTHHKTKCHNCAVSHAMKLKKTYQLRHEQQTKNGTKIFDMYGIPLIDQSKQIKYVIEVIIDRTEEVTLQRNRVNDYNALIAQLSKLLEIKGIESEELTMQRHIHALQKRINQQISI